MWLSVSQHPKVIQKNLIMHMVGRNSEQFETVTSGHGKQKMLQNATFTDSQYGNT